MRHESRSQCWDDAAMESFFSSLKTERTARKNYRMRNVAKADMFNYIGRFYNTTRRHSIIGYVSRLSSNERWVSPNWLSVKPAAARLNHRPGGSLLASSRRSTSASSSILTPAIAALGLGQRKSHSTEVRSLCHVHVRGDRRCLDAFGHLPKDVVFRRHHPQARQPRSRTG